MSDRARFGVGELIHHKLFDYRGIIFDIDPTYQGSDEWYEEVARSRPPKENPWYHVLVDGETHTTYVAERNLERDRDGRDIQHPLVDELFERIGEGRYEPRSITN